MYTLNRTTKKRWYMNFFGLKTLPSLYSWIRHLCQCHRTTWKWRRDICLHSIPLMDLISFLFSGPQCNKPLGMQNGRIRATQISATSSWDKNHGPSNGRLNFQRSGTRMGAWCARHNNQYQWLAVDFGRTMRVVKFATQGRQDANNWVTKYYLTFSQDNVFFAEYMKDSARRVRWPVY